MLQQLASLQTQMTGLASAMEEAESSEAYDIASEKHKGLLQQHKALATALEAETEGLVDAMAEVFRQDFDGMRSLPQPAAVLPHIYLGGEEEACAVQQMMELGIGAVVNCAAEHCMTSPASYPTDWDYIEFQAFDTELYPLLTNHFEAFESFTRQAKGKDRKVLVHCVAGANRSAALCVAYLVNDGVPLMEAVEKVYTLRPIILSNPGFRRQLVEFARQCEQKTGLTLLPTADALSELRERMRIKIGPKKEFDWSLYIS